MTRLLLVDATNVVMRAVREALGGYLRGLEAAWLAEKPVDYWLFPAGKMLGRKASEWRMGAGIDYDAHVSRMGRSAMVPALPLLRTPLHGLLSPPWRQSVYMSQVRATGLPYAAH